MDAGPNYLSEILDLSDLNVNGLFKETANSIVEDALWRIERESCKRPMFGPVGMFNGQTIQPSFKRIINGVEHTKSAVDFVGRPSDYLTCDFSLEAQIDAIIGCVERNVEKVINMRPDPDHTIWWSSSERARISRTLTDRGLLIGCAFRLAWLK